MRLPSSEPVVDREHNDVITRARDHASLNVVDGRFKICVNSFSQVIRFTFLDVVRLRVIRPTDFDASLIDNVHSDISVTAADVDMTVVCRHIQPVDVA